MTLMISVMMVTILMMVYSWCWWQVLKHAKHDESWCTRTDIHIMMLSRKQWQSRKSIHESHDSWWLRLYHQNHKLRQKDNSHSQKLLQNLKTWYLQIIPQFPLQHIFYRIQHFQINGWYTNNIYLTKSTSPYSSIHSSVPRWHQSPSWHLRTPPKYLARLNASHQRWQHGLENGGNLAVEGWLVDECLAGLKDFFFWYNMCMNQRYMKNYYDRYIYIIYTAYVQYFWYIVYTIFMLW